MNAVSEDVKDMLEAVSALGLQLGVGGNLFLNFEPAKPNNCVTIFDTSGYPPWLGLNGVGYEYPSVQIRVRSIDQVTGWALINAIKNALHGTRGTWGGTLYTVIYCASGPALLDWDDNNRCRFIINFNLQRR